VNKEAALCLSVGEERRGKKEEEATTSQLPIYIHTAALVTPRVSSADPSPAHR
jgi:hypothetical protein